MGVVRDCDDCKRDERRRLSAGVESSLTEH